MLKATMLVNEGKVILWGLLNCHRDNNVNPLVPVGKSYPLLLDKIDEKAVQDTLQSMIDICFGRILYDSSLFFKVTSKI